MKLGLCLVAVAIVFYGGFKLVELRVPKVFFLQKDGYTKAYAPIDLATHKVINVPNDGAYLAFPLYEEQ